MTAQSDQPSKYRQTMAYYFGFMGLGAMDAVLGPTLPALAERSHTNLAEAGGLFSVRACGYIVGSLLGGKLYDRVPGHRLLAGSLVVVAVTLALVPSAAALASATLMAVLFVMGLGAGGLDVGGNTLLVWLHRDRVAPFMNGLHLFFGLGALLAPIIVAATFEVGTSIDWAFWSIALLMSPIVLAVSLLPSPPRRLPTRSVQQQRAGSNFLGVLSVAAFLAVYVGLEFGFGGWIFSYVTEEQLLTAPNAAYLTSLYWASFTLGRLAAIPLTARLALRKVLEFCFAGALVATAAMTFYKEQMILWLGSALLGFSIGPIFPTMISLAEQRLKLTGQITSVFLVGAGLGAMSIPWLLGILMQRYGATVLLPAILGNALTLVLIHLFIRAYLDSRGGVPRDRL